MSAESMKPWADMVNALLEHAPATDMDIALMVMHDARYMLQLHLHQTGETVGGWLMKETNMTAADSERIMAVYGDLTFDETDALVTARGGVQ